MTDNVEENPKEGNSGENASIDSSHLLPVLQGVPPPESHQHQVPAQAIDVPSTVDPQLPSHNQGHCSGLNPMAPLASQTTTRQHNCHHSVVERQFCVDRMETCESCGRRPYLGWVYLCIEDTAGFSDPLDPISGPFLSPWILKAMEDGHYTTEQKEIVIHQKLNVVKMVEREKAPAPPLLSMLYAQRSAPVGHNQDDTWVELIEDVSQRGEGSGDFTALSEHTGQSSRIFQRSLPPLPCAFRACRYCERRYGNLEERTWISLNEICNDRSISPPDPWDLLGRPVSDAHILRDIGLRSQSTSTSPPHICSSGHSTSEGHEHSSIRLFSGQNITSTNLHELVNQSFNISAGSEDTELRGIGSHANESSESVIIGVAISAVVGDYSVGSEHGHDGSTENQNR